MKKTKILEKIFSNQQPDKQGLTPDKSRSRQGEDHTPLAGRALGYKQGASRDSHRLCYLTSESVLPSNSSASQTLSSAWLSALPFLFCFPSWALRHPWETQPDSSRPVLTCLSLGASTPVPALHKAAPGLVFSLRYRIQLKPFLARCCPPLWSSPSGPLPLPGSGPFQMPPVSSLLSCPALRCPLQCLLLSQQERASPPFPSNHSWMPRKAGASPDRLPE